MRVEVSNGSGLWRGRHFNPPGADIAICPPLSPPIRPPCTVNSALRPLPAPPGEPLLPQRGPKRPLHPAARPWSPAPGARRRPRGRRVPLLNGCCAGPSRSKRRRPRLGSRSGAPNRCERLPRRVRRVQRVRRLRHRGALPPQALTCCLRTCSGSSRLWSRGWGHFRLPTTCMTLAD